MLSDHNRNFPKVSAMMAFLGDLGGGQGGRFFNIVPPYVDLSKAPGYSPVPVPTWQSWVRGVVTLRHIWGSPNLLWLCVALTMYALAPYDLSASSVAARSPLSVAFFLARAPLWTATTMGYVGLCAIVCNWGWCGRPFTDRVVTTEKLAHDVFYSLAGIAIWTCFENVFACVVARGLCRHRSARVIPICISPGGCFAAVKLI